MSDKDRPNNRDKVTVTPQPTRADLFDFIEDKFNGPSSMVQYFKLKVAVGPFLQQYREETIHEKEFKVNTKKPERDELVKLANVFTSVAQNHCDQVGKPTGYCILAINHTKAAQAYGIYLMKLRPSMPMGAPDNHHDDTEMLTDEQHRDKLLHHQLEHVKQSDEHVRWMHDNSTKAIGGVLSIQQQIIERQQDHIKFLEGQRLEAFRAIEEAQSKKEERDMARKQHEFKLGLFQHGFDVVKQLVPVVVKTLDRHRPAEIAGGTITESAESMAIKNFISSITEEQKSALFGVRLDESSPPTGGIFTVPQIQIIGAVAELMQPPSILDALMEGQYAITPEQIAKAQTVVSIDLLMGLYMMLQERQKQKREAAHTEPPHPSA